jgi:hypothetical protein
LRALLKAEPTRGAGITASASDVPLPGGLCGSFAIYVPSAPPNDDHDDHDECDEYDASICELPLLFSQLLV